MPIDIETLNGPQREAVVTIDGPLLVLAGAGSGKTRVLTYRIANLIENHDVAPWEILAITFTNKAAAEMRERLNGLVGPRCRGMWVSTFHSMCVRILRADAERLGFTRNFTIYDTDDQKRLYKEIMAEFDIDPKRFPVNALMNRISAAKNELIVPSAFEKEANDPVGKVAARVYARLQERLKAANAFDFDDLLLYAFLLLKNHRTCGRPTRAASATSWWTSTKTRTTPSTPSRACWPRGIRTSWWWATTTSPSTRGAAPICVTSWNSKATTPRPRW